jgi:uncharacterized protein YndB with AHSA1/START domain
MTEANTTDSVTIERTFAAAPEIVWKLWAEPAHFAAWYGPDGSSIAVATMDLRVGGTRLLCMDVVTPQGPRQMWFTGSYLEIVENQRLVYTDSLADEHGNVMSAEQLGMPAGHPTITEVHVELEAAPGGTRMALTHVGIPAGSPGAVGWTMALDKLDLHIQEHIAE